MILGSWIELEIGKQYKGLIDGDLKQQPNPYVVLREATFEEWIADYPRTLRQEQLAKAKLGFFYQISID